MPTSSAIGFVDAWRRRRRIRTTRRRSGPNQGRGVAAGSGSTRLQSSATVTVNEDGTRRWSRGTTDIGGSRASMAMLAAETLAFPYDERAAVVVDTSMRSATPIVTGGSRTTFATGLAVIEAARDLIAKMCARARRDVGCRRRRA